MDNHNTYTPFLSSNRLYFTKITSSHCTQNYLSWLHDKEVNLYLESGRYPETLDSLLSFVNNAYTKEVLFLAIHKKEDNKHIGNIKIDGINRLHSFAEYGILMGDKSEWRKGFAKEASITILNHCFNRLNIRKINLGVLNENKGAIKLYEQLGFKTEGCLKKHIFSNGEYKDVIRMAIFKSDLND